MFTRLFARAAPAAKLPESDTLILETGPKLSGLKLMFKSKLTSASDDSVSGLRKVLFLKDMKSEAAKTVKDMICGLGLTKSRQPAVRQMAEMTLNNIKTNQAASRSELDRLFLLSALVPEPSKPGELNSVNPDLKRYARRRAEVCLGQTLGLSAATTQRYSKALLDYADNPERIIATAISGLENPEVLLLNSTLRGLAKSLKAALPKLQDADPLKSALSALLASLEADLVLL